MRKTEVILLVFLQGLDHQVFLKEIVRNLIKDSRQYRFSVFASRFRISSKCIVVSAASLLPILQYQPRSCLRKTTGAKGAKQLWMGGSLLANFSVY